MKTGCTAARSMRGKKFKPEKPKKHKRIVAESLNG